MKVRAAVLDAMGLAYPYARSLPLSIQEIDLDPPGPGEVLVRIRAAGLCHSDLSVINGDRPRPMPMALGHEAAGEVVEALGEGVTDLAKGDHVVLVFVPSCGHCAPCSEGRPALCEPGAQANGAGTLLGGGAGCHARRCPSTITWDAPRSPSTPTVSRRSLVKIDPTCRSTHAALFGCAVLTGVGAVVNTAQVARVRRTRSSASAAWVSRRCSARRAAGARQSWPWICRPPSSTSRVRSARRMRSTPPTPDCVEPFARPPAAAWTMRSSSRGR